MSLNVNLNASQQKAYDLIQKVNSGDESAIDELCMGIFDATAGKWGTDEDFINQVLDSSDAECLTKIMDRYSDVTGSEIYKDIENDYSGKEEKRILNILDNAYVKEKGTKYTGDDDGKLSIQQTAKSIWNGIKDKALSIGLIAAGTVAAPAIASAAGTILTGIFGAAAATVAAVAGPVLAVVGIATAGYMIYKGVTQTVQAVEDAKNAKTDSAAMDAVESGTEGVIETAEGAYIGYQSVSQLVKLKNVANNKTVKLEKGEYGYQCENSKPLDDFSKVINEDIKSNALATNRYAGDTYLKGNINQALATQDVHDCACVSLSNSDTETQVLYHVMAKSSKESIASTVKYIMPEGFDNVTIIPGDAVGTDVTVNNALKAIESINGNVEVNFAHMNAKIPAIVSYKGQVYQMANNTTGTVFKQGDSTSILEFLSKILH